MQDFHHQRHALALCREMLRLERKTQTSAPLGAAGFQKREIFEFLNVQLPKLYLLVESRHFLHKALEQDPTKIIVMEVSG